MLLLILVFGSKIIFFRRWRTAFVLFRGLGVVFWKHCALSKPMSEVEIMHVYRFIHRSYLRWSPMIWPLNPFSKRVFCILMRLFKFLNFFRQIVVVILTHTLTFKALHPSACELALFQQILSPVKFALLGFNVKSAACSFAWHQHSRNLNLQEW
jgi:hypothetical protein